jgi:hypothetical protein
MMTVSKVSSDVSCSQICMHSSCCKDNRDLNACRDEILNLRNFNR